MVPKPSVGCCVWEDPSIRYIGIMASSGGDESAPNQATEKHEACEVEKNVFEEERQALLNG